MPQVFIITPKLDFRESILPRLPEVIQNVGGLEILGMGRTGIKVRLIQGEELPLKQFPADIQAHCFFEPVRKFVLAS